MEAKLGEPLLSYIDLLTDTQKRAGYFVAQDKDFVHLFHRGEVGNPRCVAVFLHDAVTIEEIREIADKDLQCSRSRREKKGQKDERPC